jgi:outer membrane protein TolC
LAAAILMSGAVAASAQAPAAPPAQAPQPVERLSFKDAIQRAVDKNPSSAIAAAGILRAEALLRQARSAASLQITGNVTTTTLNKGVEFEGTTVSPQNSITGTVDVTMPVYAPAAWARRAQSLDQQHVAELGKADTTRQISLETADAYLTIIARRRVVQANERARDTARAHFDLARELEQQGSGSRLNELRAQQEESTDEGLVEGARLLLYQAQEALGVLLAADGPIDASEEPAFAIPADIASAPNPNRTDLKLFSAEQQAAERVVRDSAKDRFPSLVVVFEPQATHPSPFFTPSTSWRLMLEANVPIFDSGLRTGQKTERQAALDISRANLAGALTRASSETRAGREAVASAQRTLTSVTQAADEAQQVVNIVNVSFRAGAATNIEVIDAERSARDADTAVANGEDALRRARLDLLDALGLFP